MVNAPQPGVVQDSELEVMYPPCSATITNHCMEWQEDSLDSLAHWEIRGIGGFQHQYDVGSDNAWWTVELEDNPNIVNVKNASFSGKYYIEQLALNNTNTSPLGDQQTVPKVIPSAFTIPAVLVTSPNSLSLMEIYARNLLKPAVEYSAGFTQYWYDVVNTPPYLKQVKVTQTQVGTNTKNTIYSTGWVDHTKDKLDIHRTLDTCYFSAIDCGFGTVYIPHVESRSYDPTYGNDFDQSHIRHISAIQPITLELTFNEPIKQITQLRLGKFQADGNCVFANTCLDLTTTGPLTRVAGNPPEGVTLTENDKVWAITITTAQLALLNGKVQLSVKALDKNNHRDGTDSIESTIGGELDSTPNTPAKRNLFKVNETPTLNHYPWHNESAVAIDEDEDAANTAYSYDPGADTSHTLLFDTLAPTGSISVDVTL